MAIAATTAAITADTMDVPYTAAAIEVDMVVATAVDTLAAGTTGM
jgi:hypothetical protein